MNNPVIDTNGNKYWYNDKKQYHRLDGPAIKYANGNKYWYQNDKRHRLDGPAIELANGTKKWYQNGKYHRLDGPAVEYADGTKYWFVNSEKLTEEEFNACYGDLYKALVKEFTYIYESVTGTTL